MRPPDGSTRLKRLTVKLPSGCARAAAGAASAARAASVTSAFFIVRTSVRRATRRVRSAG